MICEYCGNEFTEKYSKYTNGRFCSRKCGRGFSTKTKRSEINSKVSLKLKGLKYGGSETNIKARTKALQAIEAAKNIRDEQDRIKSDFTGMGVAVIKRIILKDQNHLCALCGITDFWNGSLLIFHLDHIDGNNQNSLRTNLRLVCPNCHSQTDTYASKNKRSTKVSDEDLIKSIKENDTFAQALISVGLTPKGGNYKRVKKLFIKEVNKI